MADSGTKDLGSILSAGLYRIPDYQRGYAWTTNEVNDLLDDLQYVSEESDAPDEHYLNSIIVAERGEQDEIEVIDGQQRLITTSLLANEILRKAEELHNQSAREEKEEDRNTDFFRGKIQETLYDRVFKSIYESEDYRVLPSKEHKEVYTRLVTPDIEKKRHISDIKQLASSPSEQKLVSATKTVRKRLDDMLDGSDGPAGKLLELRILASDLCETFTATLHIVKSPNEAGRIFEAINDRGKDLNRADKIKSYIVYRASFDDVNIGVNSIHKTFTNIYDKLNKLTSNPSETDILIDRLVGQHWNMFAGQKTIDNSDYLVGRHDKATEDIEQIKRAKYHIPKNADGKRAEKWINAYIRSLENSATAYIHTIGMKNEEIYREAKKEMSDEANPSNIRHYIYATNEFAPSTIHSLLIAVNLRFSGRSFYERLTESFEKLALRMFAIGGARRDTKRNDFESLSHALFWSGRDDLTDVYPEISRIPESVENSCNKYGINGSAQDVNKVIELVDKWSYEYSHDNRDNKEVDVFEERLRKDNLEGLGVAGWGGVGSPEVKNYLLYRYEVDIREGGAVDPPKYLKSEIHDYTVEHVWPTEQPDSGPAAGIDSDDYQHYVERLGNLTLLSLSENSTAQNEDYETKWKKVYKAARDGMKTIRDEFPDPTGETRNSASEKGFTTWRRSLIEWRSERMAKTLAEYWGV